jgi:hypothetical protein
VVRDAGQDVGELGKGIDSVELGRFDQSLCDGCGLAPRVWSVEEVVLAFTGDGTHAVLGGDIFQFEHVVVKELAQALHADLGISDGVRERGVSEIFLGCRISQCCRFGKDRDHAGSLHLSATVRREILASFSTT